MFLLGPLGPGELILIALIIVIIFGARRLPELGKSLGQGIKNFKKSISSEEKEEKNKKSIEDKNKPSSKD
ncbi:MAG: twin-arginine translocase TatA/TatE family subunit [Candidatus Aminicenantes bacterium]